MSLSDELKSLFLEDWCFEMKDNPEFASQAGEHNSSGVLNPLQDVSPEGYERRAEHSSLMKRKINDIIQDARARNWRCEQLISMTEEENQTMKIFDILCFKGNKHMKRGQGLKLFPGEILYTISKRVDLLEYIELMFKSRFFRKEEENPNN